MNTEMHSVLPKFWPLFVFHFITSNHRNIYSSFIHKKANKMTSKLMSKNNSIVSILYHSVTTATAAENSKTAALFCNTVILPMF